MARTIRNAKLDSRSARLKLGPKREPYWTVISRGGALGYRRGAKAGTWIARFRDDAGKQHYRSLGATDDALDADGHSVLSFPQAQEQARVFFHEMAVGDGALRNGVYTVADAVADYLRWFERNRKSLDRTKSVIDAHILPALGTIELRKLRKRVVEDWHADLAKAPARVRAKRGKPVAFRDIDMSDREAERRRRSSANRALTVLKAALNRAREDGKVATDAAWATVKPFRGVDAARVRYLSDDEARRLVNAAPEPFRSLVTAALVTGCRYGELASLTAGDFNPDAGTLLVRESKSGKPRHVALTEEGVTFFRRMTAGRRSTDPIFTRTGGRQWQHADQTRPMRVACEVASIDPPISFHGLRHTYASRLVMAGAPLAVVAEQLGHSDTRMVEKHYGHLAPGYVANTVRAVFSDMGLAPKDNVVPLAVGEV